MRSPLADIALEIHVLPVGLLPVTQVAPPSRDTCSCPPASPATMTSPVGLADRECQMRRVGSASVQLYAGVAAAAMGCTAAAIGKSAAVPAGTAGSPPPPHAL